MVEAVSKEIDRKVLKLITDTIFKIFDEHVLSKLPNIMPNTFPYSTRLTNQTNNLKEVSKEIAA